MSHALSFQTPHARWQALTHRSPAAHSAFVYGVKSTKIYCRPTCSARLARRANVVFFDTRQQALVDGFRPCKRCQPDDEAFFGESERLTSKVISLLRDGKVDAATSGGIKALAKEAGVTPSYLCRVFKKVMGVTIGTYMREFDKQPAAQQTFQSLPESTDCPGSNEWIAGLTPDHSNTFTGPVSGSDGSLGFTPMGQSDQATMSIWDFNFDVTELAVSDTHFADPETKDFGLQDVDFDEWLQDPAVWVYSQAS